MFFDFFSNDNYDNDSKHKYCTYDNHYVIINHKINCMPAEGYIDFGDKHIEFSPEKNLIWDI